MARSQAEMERQWIAQRVAKGLPIGPVGTANKNEAFNQQLAAAVGNVEHLARGIRAALPARRGEPTIAEMKASHQRTLRLVAEWQQDQQQAAQEAAEQNYQNWRRSVMRRSVY